jgi:hypothetical protein
MIIEVTDKSIPGETTVTTVTFNSPSRLARGYQVTFGDFDLKSSILLVKCVAIVLKIRRVIDNGFMTKMFDQFREGQLSHTFK